MSKRILLVAVLLIVLVGLSCYALSWSNKSVPLAVINPTFQNGGFETGDLTGWSQLAGGTFEASTQHVHSGNYALHLVAPSSSSSPVEAGVAQSFTPLSLPVTVTAYWYNVQWPSACGHLYTQWAVGDNAGHVLETAFLGGSYNGLLMVIPYTGYSVLDLPQQPLNSWIKWTAKFYSDHLEFYLNDVLEPLTSVPGSTWTMNNIAGIQLFNSCSAVTYVDDVQIGGSSNDAVYYVKDNANNRYQVANGGSARVIPPVSFEVNTGNVQNIQGVRVTIDGSPYAMTSEGSSMYGSASIPLSAGSHTVQFQYLTSGSWNILAVMTLNGGSESPTDQGVYSLVIGILIATIILVIYKRRRS